LAVLSGSGTIFSLSIPSQARIVDRVLKRLKMSRFFALTISILACSFWIQNCKAQISNELAFEQKVVQLFGQKKIPVDSLSGFLTKGLHSNIMLSQDVNRCLDVEIPKVAFSKLENHYYQRMITSVVTFRDSIEQSFSLQMLDTVPRSALRSIRKSDYLELRGDNPQWTSKFILPILLIGTGIAGIISLFYLRS
jgi:hypothetical protein